MTATFRDELAAMDILAWLPEAQLIDLAATCVRQVVTSGTAVEFPVRSAGAVFVLLTGALKTVNESELGEADHNPHWFRSGDVFADPETLSHRLSEITLVAEGDCVLACIGTADFRSLMANNLEFSLVLRKHLQDLDAGSTSAQANGHDVTSVTKLINAGMLNLVKQAPAVTEGINISPPKNSINNTVPVSIEQDEVRGRLVLVVEDDPVSQRMIEVQLDGLGYAALMADNGAEGLQIWRTRHIGLVLTDCHMPEMDGYEFTGAIRKLEAEAGDEERIPIVAITANALQGEVDRCLDAGMDDYLSKPLEMDKLKKTLAKWMPASATAGVEELELSEEQEVSEEPEVQETAEPEDVSEPEVSSEQAPSDGPAIDDRALKDIFGDDDETFKEILGDFGEPSLAIVKEIQDAFSARDAKIIGASGHKLKSSSRSVGAHTLADLCAELEKAGKAEDWETIDSLMPGLEPSMTDVMNYIEAL